MKPRFWIFMLVLAFGIGLLLWHRRNNAKMEINNFQTTEAVSHTNSQTTSVPPANKPNVFSSFPPPNLAQTNVQNRTELLKEALEKRNLPIAFYGQVIDQDSNALSEVRIQMYIRHWELTSNALSRPIYLDEKTDGNGRFEITEETGDGLDVKSIQKDGYNAEPGQRSFGSVGGSYSSPVIFKMWSNATQQQLITGQTNFSIIPDGRRYYINLDEGTISESETGELRVWVKRPDQITYGRRYDWTCEIDALNGNGLLQEPDVNAAMYQAPTAGYTTSFSYQEDATTNGWGDTTGPQRFYVLLANGQKYGRINIELEAYYNNQIPGMLRLSYVINPSGSQNLEPSSQ